MTPAAPATPRASVDPRVLIITLISAAWLLLAPATSGAAEPLIGPVFTPATSLPPMDGEEEDDDEDDEEEADEAPSSDPPFDNFALPAGTSEKNADLVHQAFRDADRFVNRGSGEEREVVRSLKRAERAVKDLPAIDYYLGAVYLREDDRKRARKHLDAALEANPKFYEAMSAYAELLARETEVDEALEHYDRALDLHPWYQPAMWGKADVLVLQAKWQEAEKEYLRLKKVADDQGGLFEYVERSMALMTQGPQWAKEYRAESKNYIIRTSVSQSYAEEIASCAEQSRKLYESYFDDIPRVDRKYDVFVFKDRNEYMRNGGPRGAGGHYSPLTRTLNLYRYADPFDTLIVLQHEGFHQYCHEYLRDIPQWFNEGLGDFFSGALISPTGKRAAMAPAAWRIDLIKMAIQRNACPTAEELMLMSREQMYGQNVGVHYAQAWAITYYCMESGQKKYANALKNYFSALRKGYDQREAYAKTFANLDMRRFETNWRKFIDKQPSADEIKRMREALDK